MRFLFLFLFLINAGFGYWQYVNPPLSSLHANPLPQNVQSIDMIAESKNNESPLSGSVQVQNILGQCYTLGPFNDEAQAQSILKSIVPKVKEALLRSKQEVRNHRYWVYIPSQKNRRSAIAVSKALARKKIKDYYIVSGGDRKNSISLGHFKEKEHADRRLKMLQQQGFDASIEPIYREYKLYWLDYAVLENTKIDETLWADLLPNGVGRLKRECN